MQKPEAVEAFDKCAEGLAPTCQAVLAATGGRQPATVSREFHRSGDLLRQQDSAQNLFLLLAARGLCSKLFLEQTLDWIEMQKALDGLHSAIEARTDFPGSRPATASSARLLQDLVLFSGRFIQSYWPATENRRAYFTRAKDYNTQSLVRGLYAWAMWKGFLEGHDLSEEEFQEFRKTIGREG